MKFNNNKRFLWEFIILIFLTLALSFSQTLGEAKLVPESITEVTKNLRTLNFSEIEESGGNPDAQRLHFVFGFSTGHFGFDPVRAQAARSVAWELVNSTLIKDDLLSVYSFEMIVWDHPNDGPANIPADVGEVKERLRSLFPLAPQANSTRGHDTELAIVDIANDIEMDSGPIIVLFTNRAASITTSPETRPIIGGDDPRYKEVLTQWKRLESINQTGASFEPSYDILREDGSSATQTFDVIVLVPKTFRSSPLENSTRTERLLAEAKAPTNSISPNNSLFLILLLVLIIGGLAFLFLRKRGLGLGSSLYVSVHDHKFDFGIIKSSDVICYLVGPKYQEVFGVDPKAIIVSNKSLPAEKLARVKRHKNDIIIENEVFSLITVNGEIVSAPYRLKHSEEYEVELQGHVQANPSMPSQDVVIKINIVVGV